MLTELGIPANEIQHILRAGPVLFQENRDPFQELLSPNREIAWLAEIEDFMKF